MITTRDRPIEEVRNALLRTLDGSEESLPRSQRRRTARDAELPIPQTSISDVVVADGTNRKNRLVKTLGGNTEKGTVVVAIRGTDDITDLALDRIVFRNPQANYLKPSPEYQEIKDHIEENLRLLFSVSPEQPRAYKRSWDVFATGHSLGGAITDQLILDNVVKGGVTFAAPKTIDSKFTQPSYGLINLKDGVIGLAKGQENSPYDLVVPGVPYLEANTYTQHNMAFLKPTLTATLTDQYAKYNNKRYRPTEPEKDYNLSTGSGRAPELHTMFDAASNAYTTGGVDYKQSQKDFLEQGLYLPELTLRRKGKALVMFYVFSTPQFGYFEMPIRSEIETAMRSLVRGGEDMNDLKTAMLLNNF